MDIGCVLNVFVVCLACDICQEQCIVLFKRSLQARLWLIPVIQHFGRLRLVDHLGAGVQDQPGQHGKTPSLLKKIQKLSRCGCTSL